MGFKNKGINRNAHKPASRNTDRQTNIARYVKKPREQYKHPINYDTIDTERGLEIYRTHNNNRERVCTIVGPIGCYFNIDHEVTTPTRHPADTPQQAVDIAIRELEAYFKAPA